MRARAAFTLIEVLIVLVVIAIISSALLATLNLLRNGALRQRTELIMRSAIQGLELWRADRGGTVTPAEHPLAGSLGDATHARASFVRANGSPVAVPTGVLPLVGLSAVSQVLPAQEARVLLPDDRCAEADVPLLYGASRQALGVLGPWREHATLHRRVVPPLPGAGPWSDADARGSVVPAPLVPAGAPGRGATGPEIDALLDTVLAGAVRKELVQLGALLAPPDDSQLAMQDRVWASPSDGRGQDRASVLRVASSAPLSPYRLRGSALYDAWGRELLFTVDAAGALGLSSAGRDGVLRWQPGDDGIFQTAPAASAAAGDDRDGSRDNLATGATP